MRSKSTLSFITSIIAIIFSLLAVNSSEAQENGIYELQAISTSVQQDRSDFKNLAYKLHPTAYIENGAEKSTYGRGLPIKLTLEDFKSLSILNNIDSKYAEVELIILKVKEAKDLSLKLDLTTISGLDKLKYIFIKNEFKCTESQIRAFIKTNSNVRVFYTSEKPS